jgi:FAD/FMN-containing dehydrogenase
VTSAGPTPVSLPTDVVPVPAQTLDALASDLVAALGGSAVSRDETARRTASTDWAHMSPVLEPLLPGGIADLVVTPADAAGIALAVALAVRHGVPVTPRGQGTGNYGQGIPLYGGMVLDTSRANTVLEVTEGAIRLEAGTSFVAAEKAARATGQELAILPSTVGSTVAGFIAGGSGGTGSLENGAVWDGYLLELGIVAATGDAHILPVHWPDTTAFAHAYGVTGIIATATVALRPAREWTAVFASFPGLDDAVRAGEELFALQPPPRLVSLDEPGIVATYRPADPALPPDRVSLRAIATVGSVETVRTVVEAHGGRVEAVRAKGPALLASLSYNHVTHRVRKVRPELTHLQAMGAGMTRRRAEWGALVEDSLMHLEGFRTDHGPDWVGMLFCRFDTTQRLYGEMAALATAGVDVSDPHSWLLTDRLELVRATKARLDPHGLLNPGKLPAS